MGQKTVTLEIPPLEAPAIRATLIDEGLEMADAPYAFFRAKGRGCTITFYNKGKLVIQAPSPDDWIALLAPDELDREPFDEALAKHPDPPPPRWIGIDETGKGDYFGPLVVVAAVVDRHRLPLLVELGVGDSKKIADAKVVKMAGQLKSFCPFKKLIIRPERYNALYADIGNLNRLLAWGHTRALEDLLEAEPDVTYAISDQFAKREDTLRRALKERGRAIHFDQWHKAESDPAVAVASILARAEFLWQIKGLEKKAGRRIPKGAGPPVLAAAREILAAEGREALGGYAKLHFKTTDQL